MEAALARSPTLAERFANESAEYADECSHYLVDVVGDAEHDNSQSFQAGEDPLLEPLRWLVAWSSAGRDSDGLPPLLDRVNQILENTI